MKKNEQLGMNAGTASHRLVKDILFSLVKHVPCYHCGEALERENFSIEHKIPWLDSDDPVKLFFDLENISYSHKACNFGAARKNKTSELHQKLRKKRNNFKAYDPIKRRATYRRYGY